MISDIIFVWVMALLKSAFVVLSIFLAILATNVDSSPPQIGFEPIFHDAPSLDYGPDWYMEEDPREDPWSDNIEPNTNAILV
jgi:hypothetical protein